MRAPHDLEDRVRRLAEAQHLSLVRCDEPRALDNGGYRLVDPVSGAPMSALCSARDKCRSLADIERELASGRPADSLDRCQELYAQAAKHGLTLEPRQWGSRWTWSAREVCGMPVASDMSYTQLRKFLRHYQEPPLVPLDMRAEPSAESENALFVTAY